MPTALRLCCSVYGRLLAAYPRELRDRFASEMTLVFAEQMRDEWRLRGVRGVLRTALIAGIELVNVAAPLRLRSSIVVAAATSFVISSTLLLAFFRTVAPGGCK